MKQLSYLFFALMVWGCEYDDLRPDECYWQSFSYTTCDTLPGGDPINIVMEIWSSKYPIPSKECDEITKRRLSELRGIFIMDGEEVNPSDLMRCNCE